MVFTYKNLLELLFGVVLPLWRLETPGYVIVNKPSCYLHLLDWLVELWGFSPLDLHPMDEGLSLAGFGDGCLSSSLCVKKCNCNQDSIAGEIYLCIRINTLRIENKLCCVWYNSVSAPWATAVLIRNCNFTAISSGFAARASRNSVPSHTDSLKATKRNFM